jgi:hypothetical protein
MVNHVNFVSVQATGLRIELWSSRTRSSTLATSSGFAEGLSPVSLGQPTQKHERFYSFVTHVIKHSEFQFRHSAERVEVLAGPGVCPLFISSVSNFWISGAYIVT